MARAAVLPTVTMSICVSADEAQMIRDAAADETQTVSAWCAARVADTLVNQKTRQTTMAMVDFIAKAKNDPRLGRASMVIGKHLVNQIEGYVEKAEISVHAYMQAAVLDAAANALKAMAPGRALALEKAARDGTGTRQTIVPQALQTLDRHELAKGVRELLTGMRAMIRKDKASVMAAGAPTMAQRALKAGPTVTIRLAVPDFEVRAVAWMLGIDHNLLLTALTMKAAKRMTPDASHTSP